MRRAERQIMGEGIQAIIDECPVARIAMIDGDTPYIVPMNFGYFMQADQLTLYFHCANEGRKIDILRKNGRVCFEMDCGHRLIEGPAACSYSFAFSSVIGEGEISFVTSTPEKFTAMEMIMLHQTRRAGFAIPEDAIARVTILKLVSNSFTAKQANR